MPRVAAVLGALAIFLAGLAFLVLHVIPPMVKDVEGLAKKVPTYVTDFETWAEDNKQFAELNEKYDLTAKLSEQASALPSKLGDGATALGNATVSVLEHLLAAITILTLTVFLLLEGKGMFERGTGRFDKPHRDRARRIGTRIAAVVRSYVSVNVLLAVGAGLFTWIFLEILGFHLAIPMALLVAFLDLVPLIGLTIGGVLVAAVLAIDGAALRRAALARDLPRLPAAAGPRDPAADVPRRRAQGESGGGDRRGAGGRQPGRGAGRADRDPRRRLARGDHRRAGAVRTPARRSPPAAAKAKPAE